MIITGLPPRAVWAMRADEGMRMLEARSKLNRRGRQGGPKANGAKPDVETVDLGGGRREVRFNSIAGLRSLLQRAPEKN